MADTPSTSGFLCHTCIWHSRTESHELMDIETLISHGQRYHYLQASQFGAYLGAAYHVKRVPNSWLDEEASWLYEQVYNRWNENLVQAWANELLAKVEEVDVEIKAEDLEPSQTRVYGPSGHIAEHSQSMIESREHEFEEFQEASGGILNLPRKTGSDFHESIACNHSASFLTSPEVERWQVDFQEDYHSKTISPNLHYLKSISPDASFQFNNANDANASIYDLSKAWWKEEWALSSFDYELACTPIFAAQLEDYQNRMSLARSTYSTTNETIATSEPRNVRDTLHVWPEKVPSAIDVREDNFEGPECSREREASSKLDDYLGEAVELMDWWHTQGHSS